MLHIKLLYYNKLGLQVWDLIERQKPLKQPKSTEEPWQVFIDAWNNLPAEYHEKLFISESRRTGAVLQAKGDHIRC